MQNRFAHWEANITDRKKGFGKEAGPQTVIKTRKGMTSVFVDILNINRWVNIVNSNLKETDRLSDDLRWLLLTVIEHTCLSGHTLSGYLQQPTYCVLILSTL